jgi:hypothetical protein
LSKLGTFPAAASNTSAGVTTTWVGLVGMAVLVDGVPPAGVESLPCCVAAGALVAVRMVVLLVSTKLLPTIFR